MITIARIADDDGDEILVEADGQAVYLTVNAEPDDPGPGFEDHVCPGRCVALKGVHLDLLAKAIADAGLAQEDQRGDTGA